MAVAVGKNEPWVVGVVLLPPNPDNREGAVDWPELGAGF